MALKKIKIKLLKKNIAQALIKKGKSSLSEKFFNKILLKLLKKKLQPKKCLISFFSKKNLPVLQLQEMKIRKKKFIHIKNLKKKETYKVWLNFFLKNYSGKKFFFEKFYEILLKKTNTQVDLLKKTNTRKLILNKNRIK